MNVHTPMNLPAQPDGGNAHSNGLRPSTSGSAGGDASVTSASQGSEALRFAPATLVHRPQSMQELRRFLDRMVDPEQCDAASMASLQHLAAIELVQHVWQAWPEYRPLVLACCLQLLEPACYLLWRQPRPRTSLLDLCAGVVDANRHKPNLGVRYRHRPFLAITEHTPPPCEGSDEWLLPEWISWRHWLAHPPRCDYRMQIWDGFHWQNGPRSSDGAFDGLVRDPWEAHRVPILQVLPGPAPCLSELVLYPALRSPLQITSASVGVGSEDEIEDDETAPSCIFCLSSRATVSVPCPAEHFISCEACTGEIHLRGLWLTRCPLCRFELPQALGPLQLPAPSSESETELIGDASEFWEFDFETPTLMEPCD